MSTAVDTSVVIAWQTPEHVFHADATRLIGDAEPPLYMDELNLAEVLVGLDRSDWPGLMETLAEMGFEFVRSTAAEVAAARLDSRLRIPDACVLAAARAAKADAILTFDAALATAADRLGIPAATRAR
ncbi:MAG: PIN domain-containing protein [Propionibacteriaceae bacterium]|nr:PIN domain-containing protein [Propionibacteriaceae bacterium]